MAEQERVDIIVALKDELSRPADKVEQKIDDIGDSADDAAKKVDGLETSLDEAGEQAKETGTEIAGAGRSTKTYTRETARASRATRHYSNSLRNVQKMLRAGQGVFSGYFTSLKAYRVLFTDMGAAIPQVITGVYSLGAGLTALVAPLGRVLGNAGQIVPLIGTFGQGIGTLVLGLKGIPDAISAMGNPEATLEEINEAMKGLGPNARDFVFSFMRVKRETRGFRRSVQEALFGNDMGKTFERFATRILPILRKNLTGTARVMNKGFGRFMNRAGSKENRGLLNEFMGSNNKSMEQGTRLLSSWYKIFLKLGVSAGPAFTRTLDRMADGASRLARNIDTDELSEWFMRAADSGSAFWKGTKDLARGLGGVFRAASGLSSFMTGGLLDKLDRFSDWANSTEGQESMTEFFDSMRPNLEALGNLTGSVADAVHDISGSPVFADFINLLATDGVPALAEIIQALDVTVNPALMRMGDALAEIDIDGVFKPVGDILNGMATAAEIVAPAFERLPQPMKDLVGYLIGLKLIGAGGVLSGMAGAAWDLSRGLGSSVRKGKGLKGAFGLGSNTGVMNVTAGVVNVNGPLGGPGKGGRPVPGVIPGKGGPLRQGPGKLAKIGKGAAGLGVAAASAAAIEITLNDLLKDGKIGPGDKKKVNDAMSAATVGGVVAMLNPAVGAVIGVAGAADALGLTPNGKAREYREMFSNDIMNNANRNRSPFQIAEDARAKRHFIPQTARVPGTAPAPNTDPWKQEKAVQWNAANDALRNMEKNSMPMNTAKGEISVPRAADVEAVNGAFKNLGFNIDAAKDKSDRLTQHLNAMPEIKDIALNMVGDAETKVPDLKRTTEGIPASKNISVTAQTETASVALQNIRAQLANITSKTIGVSVNLPKSPLQIVGSGTGVLKQPTTSRALGGPTAPGMRALVGEVGPEGYVTKSGKFSMIGQNGPEVRTFKEDGYVIPHHMVKGAQTAYQTTAGVPVPSGEDKPAERQPGAFSPKVKVVVHGDGDAAKIKAAVTEAMQKAEREHRRRK